MNSRRLRAADGHGHAGAARSSGDVLRPAAAVARPLTLLSLPLAVVVLFARQRRATGRERLQLRWLLWAAVMCLVVSGVALVAAQRLDRDGRADRRARAHRRLDRDRHPRPRARRRRRADGRHRRLGDGRRPGHRARPGPGRRARRGARRPARPARHHPAPAAGRGHDLRAGARLDRPALVRRALVGRRGDRYAVVADLAARLEESADVREPAARARHRGGRRLQARLRAGRGVRPRAAAPSPPPTATRPARDPRGADPLRRRGGRPARAARPRGAVDAVASATRRCSSTSSGRPRWRCAAPAGRRPPAVPRAAGAGPRGGPAPDPARPARRARSGARRGRDAARRGRQRAGRRPRDRPPAGRPVAAGHHRRAGRRTPAGARAAPAGPRRPRPARRAATSRPSG